MPSNMTLKPVPPQHHTAARVRLGWSLAKAEPTRGCTRRPIIQAEPASTAGESDWRDTGRDDPRCQLPVALQIAPAQPFPLVPSSSAPLAPAAATGGILAYDLRSGQVTDLRAATAAIAALANLRLEMSAATLPGKRGDDPGQAITKLYVTMPNGQTRGCSGVLIGPRHVLTAAHVVYAAEWGGLPTQVIAVPGLQGTDMPYGLARVTTLRLGKGFLQPSAQTRPKWEEDLALLTLDTPLGAQAGWMGIKASTDEELHQRDLRLHTAGYAMEGHGAVYLHREQTRTGELHLYGNQQLMPRLAARAGQNGSPLYITTDNTSAGQVIGILSHHREYSPMLYATRLTQDKFDQLSYWLAEDSLRA
ncbi:MAG: trypsin-like peptidase domain-containing protein [Blastocatellia bacterium]